MDNWAVKDLSKGFDIIFVRIYFWKTSLESELEERVKFRGNYINSQEIEEGLIEEQISIGCAYGIQISIKYTTQTERGEPFLHILNRKLVI